MTAALLASQLRFTHYVVNANCREVTQEESLRAPGNGGNCLNWVLGHLVHSRNGFARGLGLPMVLPDEQAGPYLRKSGPLAGDADALPVNALLDAFNASQEPLMAAVAALTDEQMVAPSPFSPLGREDETVGSLVAGLIFHEAYHAGQLGVLRRTIGKPGAIR